MNRLPEIIALAQKKSPLPLSFIENFYKTVCYGFDETDQRALLTFSIMLTKAA